MTLPLAYGAEDRAQAERAHILARQFACGFVRQTGVVQRTAEGGPAAPPLPLPSEQRAADAAEQAGDGENGAQDGGKDRQSFRPFRDASETSE